MVYPLILPFGEPGWTTNIENNEVQIKDKEKYISMLQFYSYKLSIRDKFNPYINLKNLSQQFIVDVWSRI